MSNPAYKRHSKYYNPSNELPINDLIKECKRLEDDRIKRLKFIKKYAPEKYKKAIKDKKLKP